VVQHGDGRRSLHYYRSWLDDPSIPYASLIGYVAALKAGEDVERPTEELARERDRLAEEYGALLDEDARKASTSCSALSRRSSRTSRSTSSSATTGS
jgi:pyruvate,water dikinase